MNFQRFLENVDMALRRKQLRDKIDKVGIEDKDGVLDDD